MDFQGGTGVRSTRHTRLHCAWLAGRLTGVALGKPKKPTNEVRAVDTRPIGGHDMLAEVRDDMVQGPKTRLGVAEGRPHWEHWDGEGEGVETHPTTERLDERDYGVG